MAIAAVKEKAATNEPAASAEKPRTVPPFRRGDIKLLEQTNNQWRAIAPAGVTVEDLNNPNVWAAMQQEGFYPFDICHVIDVAETFYAQVLIQDATLHGGVVPLVLQSWKLPKKPAYRGDRLPEGFDVVRDGVAGKWNVLRLMDGFVMRDGFDDKESAVRYLLDHAIFRRPA